MKSRITKTVALAALMAGTAGVANATEGWYGRADVGWSFDGEYEVDNNGFLWGDNGVVHCLEAATQREVWMKRVPGNYSGSPVCVDGKLYIISEDGDVVVIAASPEFRELGRSSLGDPSYSTPAVAAGRLYLRTFHRLACLRAAAAPAASSE